MGTSWAAAVGVASRRGCSFWARRFELERTMASRVIAGAARSSRRAASALDNWRAVIEADVDVDIDVDAC